VTAMDDGPVTDRDLDEAAASAVQAHDAGRRCHTGCPGTTDCRQLSWARIRRAAAEYRRTHGAFQA